MGIIYIANARMPTQKAHGLQMAQMCKAMADLGHQVRMVVPFRHNSLRPNPSDLFEYYGIPECFAVTRLLTPDFSRLNRLHTLGGRLFQWQSLLFGAASVASIRLRWRSASLLYTRSPQVAWLLGRFCDIPFVYEANDLFPTTKRGKAAIRTLAQSTSCRLVVVVTRTLRELYISEIGVAADKIITAPNGVDLEQFEGLPSRQEARKRLGLPTEALIVGYVGRFQAVGREKGIPELIRALATPELNRPDLLLLCIGGPMSSVPSYRQLAQQVGVAERHLRFVDKVPHQQVPTWIRACDAVTIPWSRTDFSAYRTSPMKLFEYMCASAPIVASDLPAIREILAHGKNAWLVPPGDPPALAQGISRLLNDRALADKLGTRAHQDVQQHTWQNRAAHILRRASLGNMLT